MTDEDIYRHLSGKDPYARDVIGVYPMLPDETCCFLCADFDEADFEKDAAAFRDACKAYGVEPCVERSRSGNGAHVWIFFEEAIPAKTARKLGTGLLTKAMEKRGELSFRSYDRFFPNQDTMPEGGFGNLVALPLQGLARKHGNSLFVDENFIPYEDPWAYLETVRKLSAEIVENLIAEICPREELGMLVSDSDEKPWEVSKEKSLTKADFPAVLMITRANMLFLPKEGLSSAAFNKIKRLAALKNPDFYRAQAMRMPIFEKPRIISTAEITESYLAIPRGCEEALTGLLEELHIPYQIDDKTNAGEPLAVSFSGTLREEQQPAADALLAHNTGVLSATTAFGKTVVAAYLIGKRKTSTLILVHTQALMNQWKTSLERFLQFQIEEPSKQTGRGRKKAWSPVGMLGAGKNTMHGYVDVAVMQSLTDGDAVKECVRNYGMVIVDECHHVSAVNFEKILRYTNARYVYGLSATPTRQDGHHPIIFMQCGAIRYRVSAKEQAAKRSFSHYLIPRFTKTRIAAAENTAITALYQTLTENLSRNTMIVNDVSEALKCGRCPIILTERREHVNLLSGMLSKYCRNIIPLVGTASSKERRETMERLNAVPENEQLLVIATGRYVGEGFDYPRLDTLFLALPIAWKGKVAQYVGRLHRDYPGKKEVQVYDYADVHIPVLERMYQKRLKSYASLGYLVKNESGDTIEPELIYDGKTFYPVFCHDLEASVREVLIVSPFMRQNRLTSLVKQLSAMILRGISVTVVIRPPEDFKESERETVEKNEVYLKEYGITVLHKSDFHQKFTIIDQKTVWYGSVNFLSFGTHEESIMRFENEEVAGLLTDTVL